MAKEGVECDVIDCFRNEFGKCELSRIYSKDHSDYREPKRCSHYNFIKKTEE